MLKSRVAFGTRALWLPVLLGLRSGPLIDAHEVEHVAALQQCNTMPSKASWQMALRHTLSHPGVALGRLRPCQDSCRGSAPPRTFFCKSLPARFLVPGHLAGKSLQVARDGLAHGFAARCGA